MTTVRRSSPLVSTTIPGGGEIEHTPMTAAQAKQAFDEMAAEYAPILRRLAPMADPNRGLAPDFQVSPLQAGSVTDGREVVPAILFLGLRDGEPGSITALGRDVRPVTIETLAAAMPSAAELGKWVAWVRLQIETSAQLYQR